jgi:hypothetical protein
MTLRAHPVVAPARDGRDAWCREFHAPSRHPRAWDLSRARQLGRAWWGPLPEGEHFNQSVHCDWMCIGTRALGPLDGTWGANPAARQASNAGTRVVNNALIMDDLASHVVRVVTVALHSRVRRLRGELGALTWRHAHTVG